MSIISDFFNHNDIGVPNGKYFGLPYSTDEAEIVLIPVPWDVTTSYGKGTSQGPQAILDASTQVDLFDFNVEKAWEVKISNIDIEEKILEENNHINHLSVKIIKHLEAGKSNDDKELQRMLAKVNEASIEINEWVYNESVKQLNNNKIVGVVGGEHSVPLGLIKALAEKYSEIGILHIDAHADLRNAYEGFEFSHASIMNNAMKINNITSLVQVAIRDVCEDEVNLASSDNRIKMYDDYKIQRNSFCGVSWDKQCEEMISHLPENVYVSFDIDGLYPYLCPNTGTPVPGGLNFQQAVYLIDKLVEKNKKIIGFDLCEVAPGDNEWDANVGARILYKLCCYASKSNK